MTAQAPTEAAAQGAPASPRAPAIGWWLLALFVLGAIVRVVVWANKGGFHYPDETFQQLEPGYWLQTGVGWLPWEFGRGLRTWVMPGLYGGLLEICQWMGLSGLEAQRAITLHHTLWSLALIPAGYRMGRVLGRGLPRDPSGAWSGLAVAALMALMPTLVYFTPHTLQGTPALVTYTWGLVFWLEARAATTPEAEARAAFWLGLWFGVTGVVRFTSGLHMLIPLADLLLRRRGRALGRVMLGAAGPVIVLGAVDWLTWGKPFHSVIEHVAYNYIEGGASDHGVSPWDFYLVESLWNRFGPVAPAMILLLLAGLARSWRLVLTAAIPTLLLTTVAHKEERFLMNNWPLFVAAAGVGAVVVAGWMARRTRGVVAGGLAGALLLTVLASNAVGTGDLAWRWRAGIFEAQDYVGQQPDATGLLLHDRQHLNGGFQVFDRAVPQVQYAAHRARQPVFNYVAMPEAGSEAQQLVRQGWQIVARFDDIAVLKRPE